MITAGAWIAWLAILWLTMPGYFAWCDTLSKRGARRAGLAYVGGAMALGFAVGFLSVGINR